jgi:hypothetical protein
MSQVHESDDNRPATLHELLLRLDLAVETLEGLDQLGVASRDELELLLAQLERQVADIGQPEEHPSPRDRHGSF